MVRLGGRGLVDITAVCEGVRAAMMVWDRRSVAICASWRVGVVRLGGALQSTWLFLPEGDN